MNVRPRSRNLSTLAQSDCHGNENCHLKTPRQCFYPFGRPFPVYGALIPSVSYASCPLESSTFVISHNMLSNSTDRVFRAQLRNRSGKTARLPSPDRSLQSALQQYALTGVKSANPQHGKCWTENELLEICISDIIPQVGPHAHVPGK